MNDINSLYKLWCEKAVNDKDLIPELKSVEGNQDEILDRFYKNLEFGTAGLRGVIGAGTNRMNVIPLIRQHRASRIILTASLKSRALPLPMIRV